MDKRIPLRLVQVMASENKKKKANKSTDKLKRINFYNKINRAQNKCEVKDC